MVCDLIAAAYSRVGATARATSLVRLILGASIAAGVLLAVAVESPALRICASGSAILAVDIAVRGLDQLHLLARR